MAKSTRQISYRIVILIILLILSAVGWSAYAEIDEITRGNGKVIPATKTQIVQATEVGVVEHINVQVGQIVKQGDLIVRLDDTTTTSQLGEALARLLALTAKSARLELEQNISGQVGYICPEEVVQKAPQICENEAKLLEARKSTYLNTVSVLEQRKLQKEKELDETYANIARLEGEVKLSKRELALLQPMVKRRLVAKTEVLRAERAVNDSQGQLNAAGEAVERVKGAIREASLQIDEIKLQFQQQALDAKTQVLAEIAVLDETVRGGKDRVSRTDIKSPVDGIINKLTVNTIGSFVQPGEVIAEVVPSSPELLVEARVSPNDIAFVQVGQPALVKVTAYDFSIYGGLEAKVATITPDSLLDKESGESYFQVLVKTDRSYLENSGKKFSITPGMVSSVDIITGRKTILNYLMKPINKARQEALTER